MMRSLGKKADESRRQVEVCLCGSSTNQELDAASWRDREHMARLLVDSLSVKALRSLPPGSRSCLAEILSFGHVSRADRKALDKLLAAELVEMPYQLRLVIKGLPDFVEKTKAHLDAMTQTEMGQQLLCSLAASGKAVAIVPTSGVSEARPDDYRGATAKGTTLKWRELSGKERTIKGSGAGSGMTIKYNPDRARIDTQEAWQEAPPGIWLAHELIHADDAAYGRMEMERVDGLRNYERQAIGLPPYEQKEFTENRLRAEWKPPQPARTRY